jgi:serine/threonine protein kinase
VAIRVLPDFWTRDPKRLQRFELEAQAAAALNHPNIVSIFHVGQHNGFPYIVTELPHGKSLRERLRHGPKRLREHRR